MESIKWVSILLGVSVQDSNCSFPTAITFLWKWVGIFHLHYCDITNSIFLVQQHPGNPLLSMNQPPPNYYSTSAREKLHVMHALLVIWEKPHGVKSTDEKQLEFFPLYLHTKVNLWVMKSKDSIENYKICWQCSTDVGLLSVIVRVLTSKHVTPCNRTFSSFARPYMEWLLLEK